MMSHRVEGLGCFWGHGCLPMMMIDGEEGRKCRRTHENGAFKETRDEKVGADVLVT